MSVDGEPSGASPGPDDNADRDAVFPTETEEKTIPKPEKGQLVFPDSNLVQHTVPGLETSRRHGVPPSEVITEITPNGNAQQFYSNVDSRLHSKSLVNLQSPPDALQETREGGKERSMKLPLQRVGSPGDSYSRPKSHRRARSEGTTPPKDKIAVLLLENQELRDSLEKEHSVKHQSSNDESISPLMVQQLRDRIISLQKELQVLGDKHRKLKSRIQSLEQKKKDESEEKRKFKALYDDEKRRSEEIEKQAAQFEEKKAKLEEVVYLVHTGAELSPEQESLVRSVYVEQVVHVKGLDEAAAPTDQVVPDFNKDFPADPDSSLFSEGDLLPSSLGQQQPLSQDTGSNKQTLCRYLISLASTGKGDKKQCNVCFMGEPIDSHIITRKLLETACKGQECRTLLSVDLQRKSTTIVSPTTWKEKLECEDCDNSTSHLEGEFVTRCLINYYKPGTPLHKDDARVFLFYGYRTLGMRNVLQYAVKDKLASYKELESFMIQVWEFRRALKERREIDFDDVRKRVLFHVFTKAETDTSSYRIALVLCNVDLTAVDPDLNCCPLIYTKALHCCWAVLLGDHTADNLQQHFPRMINRIDYQLSQEKIEPQGIVRKNSLKIKV